MVRAEQVSSKPKPWNGIKFMLVIQSPDGTSYPQATLETGTFDWRRVSFTAHIPADATNTTLVLGLEQVSGKAWDKAQLEKALQPVITFQSRFGVHIYIGEFSVIRWAPDESACRYLSDLIDIFESHSWDWSYHAFREWSGWSVEHGSDRQDTRPASSPTERQRVLRRWFALNRKPSW